MKIVRAKFAQPAILTCPVYDTFASAVDWWLVKPRTFIGRFDGSSADTVWSRDGFYRVVDDGSLCISEATRSVVERYECIASTVHGNATEVLHFRLDYSDWYSHDVFHSVFWGSVMCAFLCCLGSFAVNILWILSRKVILWWIKRAERISRVRKMVEAIEKYRQRQIENLQETYRRKTEQVRENYHQQVELLRASYASQVEKFRDYRIAQMECVNQHLDNIRDNYYQQMCRIRDYGSRRAEHLWESYERQINRMRTFTLQQRLRLMRQYKVKQQYLNKLVQKFGDSSPDVLYNKEQSEAAVFGPVRDLEEKPLSRSSSYYSLPEFVLDEDENMSSSSGSKISRKTLNRHQQKTSPRSADARKSNGMPSVGDDSLSIGSPPGHHVYSGTDDTSLPSTSATDTPSTSKIDQSI
ncbi:hypothetical protein AB6A40_008172 [Gnathostoma spinigerum]|uniref:Ig-like domain-containing protein n=1 Tax=Gnathostoma spinigerum TaxID=75299 RepID=A0ABD6EWM0_9BILA